MLDRLQSADFAQCIHDVFCVPLTDAPAISLELAAVADLGAAQLPGGRRPFSLIFVGPVSDRYLLQGTYSLEHDSLGSLDLFLVPLGPQAGRMRYEVIFN